MADSEGTVMIVEDDDQLREALAAFLSRSGFGVVQARDGAEAVRLLPSARPDVMVVDLGMPHLDGEHFVRGLRGLSPASRTPVVVVSGQPDGARVAQRIGADSFVKKPFEPAHILKVIRRVSRQHQQRRVK